MGCWPLGLDSNAVPDTINTINHFDSCYNPFSLLYAPINMLSQTYVVSIAKLD